MEKKQVIEMLENVINERGVPRNVRESLDAAVRILDNSSKKESAKEKVSKAISILDESASDSNLETYARTQIWGIVSLLEQMKK